MKITIAVVDDDPNITFLVQSYLNKEGFVAFAYQSAEEALSHTSKYTPDLWIVDVMLPGMDGVSLCRRLRTESEVPVIFISAKDEEVDRILGIESGGDDYLTKPFSPRELVARVKRNIERTVTSRDHRVDSSTSSMPNSRNPALRIDTSGRRVFWEDQEVELTLKEYLVIEYLYLKLDSPCSREELIGAAWGTDYDGTDRVVDHVVKRIRKKLLGVELESIWGFGYRLRNRRDIT